jgi:hypothetical protein
MLLKPTSERSQKKLFRIGDLANQAKSLFLLENSKILQNIENEIQNLCNSLILKGNISRFSLFLALTLGLWEL